MYLVGYAVNGDLTEWISKCIVTGVMYTSRRDLGCEAIYEW